VASALNTAGHLPIETTIGQGGSEMAADVGMYGTSGAQQRDAGRRGRPSTALLPYSRARHFDQILSTRAVEPVYQPIVDLETREVLAYEALARGPHGSPLERPDLLFGAARDLGLVGELDWVCRARAMGGALQSGLGGGLTLFVNVEPDVAATRAPDDLFFTLKHAERDLRVVLEVTERALLARPAELLHWLSWARDRWWGVALDDVGVTTESLALMPFVNPDVIKLDFRFVRQEELSVDDWRVIEAIHTQSERTGTTVLAEGIENAKHLERARQLGATLGQGWYFGRPAPLPATLPSPRRAVPLLDRTPPSSATSPWELLEDLADDQQSLPEAHVRRIFSRVAHNMSTSLEAPVVLGAFPSEPGPWGEGLETMAAIRPRAAFCGAVGVGMERVSAPGWQTSPLPPGDDMADEWCLAVIAPHHAEVAVAYDAGDRDAQGGRLLSIATSRNRIAVTAVADHLIRRLSCADVTLDGRLVADGRSR
jgi:EAL domain-containing protein (putative c-di-GMP-specific phosphodiesterase class I)